MADLAAVNVTITKIKKHRVGNLREVIYDVVFGNGVLTYPTNGVPLPALVQFGSLTRVDWADPLMLITIDGFFYLYDKANHTIRKFQVAGHVHDLLFIGGIAATEPVVIAGGDTLGKNAATNRTIAGANSATKGGVVALAAAALSEVPGTHAPAATTLRLKLQGE